LPWNAGFAIIWSMPGKGSARERGLSKRFFLFLLGAAGLGVGVWLFRSRRTRPGRTGKSRR
jgi:hypothetical protein